MSGSIKPPTHKKQTHEESTLAKYLALLVMHTLTETPISPNTQEVPQYEDPPNRLKSTRIGEADKPGPTSQTEETKQNKRQKAISNLLSQLMPTGDTRNVFKGKYPSLMVNIGGGLEPYQRDGITAIPDNKIQTACELILSGALSKITMVETKMTDDILQDQAVTVTQERAVTDRQLPKGRENRQISPTR
jgi:hypothetical protein